MGEKSCNISNYNHWKLNFRRGFSNALFNQTYKDFDNIFRKIDIENDPSLFTESRIDKVVTDKEFFTRFDIDDSKVLNNTSNLDEFLKRKISSPISGTMYFVFGKKGVGKTTLIKHYINSYLSKNRVIPIYLDLHGLDCHVETIINQIKSRISSALYNDNQADVYFSDPDSAKKVRKEFKHLSDSDIIKEIYKDESNNFKYLDQLLIYLTEELSKRIYIFFDNTDELPVEYVSEIIRSSYDVRKDVPVRIIHCLRDYWGSQTLRFGAQYQVLKTYLTPPSLVDIITKRIKQLHLQKSGNAFVIQYYYWENHKKIETERTISYESVNKFLDEFVKEIFSDENLIDYLYEMCNYNVREALDNIYNFFHSCNLPIIPFFERTFFEIPKSRPITIDDFIRNFMTIHSWCFDFESSKISNIFNLKRDCNTNSYRNTLGLIRILQRTSIGEDLNIQSLMNDFIKIGYLDKNIQKAINYLLQKGFIESPDGNNFDLVITLSITGKGRFYLNHMIRSFEYLSYVQDRVACQNEYKTDVELRFGKKSDMYGSGSFKYRSKAVQQFLDFLIEEEKLETSEYMKPEFENVLNRVRGYDGELFKKIKHEMNSAIGNIENKIKKNINSNIITNIFPRHINDEDSDLTHVHP